MKRFNKYELGRNSTQYVFRLFGTTIFAAIKSEYIFWFRIFGYGLMVKHKNYGLKFSERIGKSKYLKIGNYILNYLPK